MGRYLQKAFCINDTIFLEYKIIAKSILSYSANLCHLHIILLCSFQWQEYYLSTLVLVLFIVIKYIVWNFKLQDAYERVAHGHWPLSELGPNNELENHYENFLRFLLKHQVNSKYNNYYICYRSKFQTIRARIQRNWEST